MAPARPIFLYFQFRNATYERRALTVRIAHGNDTRSEASVSGTDPKWVNDQFAKLKLAIETAKPQELWIIKHKTLLLNLLALAFGSLWGVLGVMLRPFVVWLFGDGVLHPLDVKQHLALFYILLWFWRWVTGLFPAFLVRRWLMTLWPSVELDVGAEHLKTEKRNRRMVVAVITLAVVPVVVQLFYDHLLK